MIIDDSMFTLGSAKFNLCSLAVDSEINVASDEPLPAKSLRQKVWALHTKGELDVADATDNASLHETFRLW